jgi:alanine racemase
MARPLQAHLSLPALRANVARAKELAPNAEILAVVKADAYGHGLMRVLPAWTERPASALVELDTALKLRAARYAKRILLLEGFFTRDELPEISHHRWPLSCTTKSNCSLPRADAARATDRGLHQDQHRNEPSRHSR